MFLGKYYFKFSFLDRIKLFKAYYLGKYNNVTLPKIISFRLVSPKDSYSAYSALDGFYGLKRGFEPKPPKLEITSESLKKLVDYGASCKAEFFLWGDKIDSSPFFPELLSLLSERKLHCRILTAFSYFNPYIEFFINGTIKEVIFSFEVPPNHKMFLQRVEQYSFYEDSVKSINYLLNHKKLRDRISGAMLINSINCFFLDEMLSWADVHALKRFYFFHSSMVSIEQGKSHNGKFMEYFKFTPHSWKARSFDGKNIDHSTILFELSRINRGRFRTKAIFCPQLSDWQVAEYYGNTKYSALFYRCYAPWFIMNVLEDGSIVSCANHPDFIFGNIKNDSFYDLWNGEWPTEFRTQLSQEKIFPICTRCCCLYI